MPSDSCIETLKQNYVSIYNDVIVSRQTCVYYHSYRSIYLNINICIYQDIFYKAKLTWSLCLMDMYGHVVDIRLHANTFGPSLRLIQWLTQRGEYIRNIDRIAHLPERNHFIHSLFGYMHGQSGVDVEVKVCDFCVSWGGAQAGLYRFHRMY